MVEVQRRDLFLRLGKKSVSLGTIEPGVPQRKEVMEGMG